jgi:hypothetical protein
MRKAHMLYLVPEKRNPHCHPMVVVLFRGYVYNVCDYLQPTHMHEPCPLCACMNLKIPKKPNVGKQLSACAYICIFLVRSPCVCVTVGYSITYQVTEEGRENVRLAFQLSCFLAGSAGKVLKVKHPSIRDGVPSCESMVVINLGHPNVYGLMRALDLRTCKPLRRT